MKKIVFLLLGIAIGAVATYYFTSTKCKKPDTLTTEKPKGVISIEQAKALNENWTVTRKKTADSIVQQQGKKEDNRSVYWNLKDVEDYITHAKKASKTLGYNMTGLRVYLGVYGESTPKSQSGLTTMFMVPTGTKNTSKAGIPNMVFDPEDEDIPTPPLNDGTGGQGGYPR
ncbi:MAG: hypothetical protein ACK5MZ_05660 [Aestuariibaculum sp.]